jgi:hypothetical protein
MIHHRQRLPLGFEARNDLPRIHPRFDDLERDRAPHRLRLLGHKHDTHAAFADLLMQLVRTNDAPRTFAEFIETERRLDSRRRRFEKLVLFFKRTQQAADAVEQRRIIAAGALQILQARISRADHPCGLKDGFFVKLVADHGETSGAGAVYPQCENRPQNTQGGLPEFNEKN